MLNRSISKSIIIIIKFVLPVTILLLLAPQLIQFSSELNNIKYFFQAHQMSFLFIHGIFYLALYWCWPRLITLLKSQRQHELNERQIKLALQARMYLLAALIVFELLVWWTQ